MRIDMLSMSLRLTRSVHHEGVWAFISRREPRRMA
jgi:hypothetical protein